MGKPMPLIENKRPWYKIRWPLTLIGIAVIIGSAYLVYLSKKPLGITVTTGPTGQNVSLKERMLFIVNLEKSMHKKGWIASLDLEGENGKILKIYWEAMDRPMAKMFVESKDIIPDIRDMGFRRLILQNGKDKWDVDLKN